MTETQLSDRPKVGRNDACWCGSGKKYKRCHLEDDERKDREAMAEPDGSAGHDHPTHPMCRIYMPAAMGVPGHMRPDFRHLLNQMRATGYTLVHIGEPTWLGKNEADYQRALEVAAEHGITVHCLRDPLPEDIQAGQQFVDRLFGEGAYTLKPVSANYRRYPELSEKTTADGALSEVCMSRSAGLAGALIKMKEDEWVRSGGAERPGLLVGTAQMGELLRDVLGTCRDLLDRAEAADGRALASAEALIGEMNLLGRFDYDGPLPKGDPDWTSLRFCAAVGLAIPGAESATGEAEVTALGLPQGAERILLAAVTALRKDPLAQDLLRAVADGIPVDGKEIRMTEALADLISDDLEPTGPQAPPADEQPQTEPEGGPIGPVAVEQEPFVPAVVVPNVHLFAEVDLEGRANVAIEERFREAIDKSVEAVAECELTATGLAAQLEENERKRADTLRHLEELQAEMAAAITEDRRGRVLRLQEVLEAGVSNLASVDQDLRRLQELAAARPEPTPEQAAHVKVIEGYEASARGGAFDQLDESLQAVLLQRVEEARAALGDRLHADAEAVPEARAVIPVAVAVGLGDGLLRVGAALPLDGVSAGTLPAGSLENALASLMMQQMAFLVLDHGSLDLHKHVSVHVVNGVTTVWMEARLNPEASDDPQLAEEYLKLVCEEAAANERNLRLAGVAVEVQAVPVELLEGLDDLLGDQA